MKTALWLVLFLPLFALAEGLIPKKTAQTLDRLNRLGKHRVDEWKSEITQETEDAFDRLTLEESDEPGIEAVLKDGDQVVYRLQREIGEGHNVLAFLTDKGTVLKLAKKPKAGRMNLLIGWIHPRMRKYGMEQAEIYKMHPLGLYVEQEFIPSESLDVLFAHSRRGIPNDIKDKVYAEWEKAYKLAQEEDIWLDFKATNFALRRDGRIANVDFGPCLGDTHDRYFHTANHKNVLSRDAALDNFFFRQIRKGSNFGEPENPEYGWRLWKKATGGTVPPLPPKPPKPKPKFKKPDSKPTLVDFEWDLDVTSEKPLPPPEKVRRIAVGNLEPDLDIIDEKRPNLLVRFFRGCKLIFSKIANFLTGQ